MDARRRAPRYTADGCFVLRLLFLLRRIDRSGERTLWSFVPGFPLSGVLQFLSVSLYRRSDALQGRVQRI